MPNSPVNTNDLYGQYSENRQFIDVPMYTEEAKNAAIAAQAAAAAAQGFSITAENAKNQAVAAGNVLENMVAVATTVGPSLPATADWDKSNGIMTFEIPQGTQGIPGYNGNTLYELGDMTANESFNFHNGSVFTGTLQSSVTTVQFLGVDALTDRASQSIVILKQGTGSNLVTWPNNIKWPNDLPPTMSYQQGDSDMFAFLTVDGGVTWLGFMSTGGF